MRKLLQKRIGDTLFIYDDGTEPEIEAKAKRALANGVSVVRADGTEEWITYNPIIDSAKVGSEQYIWDKSGEKVKSEKVRHLKSKDGTITQEVIRTVFKTYE